MNEPEADMDRSSVIMIGMPGSGKSTIGVLLAKALAKNFVDVDLIIQQQQHKTLQEIIDSVGHVGFLACEEQALLSQPYVDMVVATGGSAVYSAAGMEHLKRYGRAVFLDVSLDVLRQRLANFDTRGIYRRAGQSIESVFQERQDLYRRYADLTIACDTLNQEDTLSRILEVI